RIQLSSAPPSRKRRCETANNAVSHRQNEGVSRIGVVARTTIGLIADTHDEIVPWEKTGPVVTDALVGVSLILHCGDLTTTAVLDALAAIAPVLAVRSPGDPPAEPPRLVDGPTVIEQEGVAIGLVNSLAELTEEQSPPAL